MHDKFPFAQWWVSAVGRPPIAGEGEIYAKTQELFEYAKQLEDSNQKMKDHISDAESIIGAADGGSLWINRANRWQAATRKLL